MGLYVGYELLNEPWAGDIYSHPSQLEPRKSGKEGGGGQVLGRREVGWGGGRWAGEEGWDGEDRWAGDVYSHPSQLEPRKSIPLRKEGEGGVGRSEVGGGGMGRREMQRASWRALLTSGVSDLHNLMPLYAKLHTAIRQYDNDHIIFFEPTVTVTDVSVPASLPPPPFSPPPPPPPLPACIAISVSSTI